jgi:uncharacterized protein YkwD
MGFARALRAAKTVATLSLITTVGSASLAPAAEASLDFGGSGGGGYSYKRAERCMMRKVNRARARRGHRKLDWDKQLAYVARRHANSMADRGYIFHDSNLGQEITRWRSLGQNTGKGSGCRRLFRAFMRSSTHRHNILGQWRHMGAGTERRGGRLYVQHVFETYRNPGNVYAYP